LTVVDSQDAADELAVFAAAPMRADAKMALFRARAIFVIFVVFGLPLAGGWISSPELAFPHSSPKMALGPVGEERRPHHSSQRTGG
jgi:hypothetical protein